eukprot:scaffold25405_cov19-Prasinocladus_malaysianus.AAC.1
MQAHVVHCHLLDMRKLSTTCPYGNGVWKWSARYKLWWHRHPCNSNQRNITNLKPLARGLHCSSCHQEAAQWSQLTAEGGWTAGCISLGASGPGLQPGDPDHPMPI